MFRTYALLFIIISSFIGCSPSNRSETNAQNVKIENPSEIYIEAMQLFDTENLTSASEKFNKIIQLYPLTNEAIQSEIMISFISYLQMDYDNAILRLQKIIKNYPAHKDLDYVYYMIAMSYYEQIAYHELDGQNNNLALDSFNQVIQRFPNSKYSKDSRQKIVLVKSNQAAKHMEIGRFYLKEKKYTAALNRFSIVIENFSMTKFTPEALHRTVEAYYEMGMLEESNNVASVLGYNYPNSKWYRYSYNLIKKSNKENSFFDKVKQIF